MPWLPSLLANQLTKALCYISKVHNVHVYHTIMYIHVHQYISYYYYYYNGFLFFNYYYITIALIFCNHYYYYYYYILHITPCLMPSLLANWHDNWQKPLHITPCLMPSLLANWHDNWQKPLHITPCLMPSLLANWCDNWQKPFVICNSKVHNVHVYHTIMYIHVHQSCMIVKLEVYYKLYMCNIIWKLNFNPHFLYLCPYYSLESFYTTPSLTITNGLF